MKRWICWLIALTLLLLPAYGEEESLTMRQIMEANEASTLVEQYGSVHILVQSGEEMWERYMCPEFYYYGDTKTAQLFRGPLVYRCENGRYSGTLHAGTEIDLSSFDRIFFTEEYIDMEEILYQAESRGRILLKTQLHLSDVSPGLVAEGNYLVIDYELEPETLALLSLSEKLRLDNGQSLKTDAVIRFSYGGEPPENIQAMLDRLSHPEARAVSVILNPGDGAETVTAAMMDGDSIRLTVPEGYALFADKACKKAWRGSSVKGNLTVYAARK